MTDLHSMARHRPPWSLPILAPIFVVVLVSACDHILSSRQTIALRPGEVDSRTLEPGGTIRYRLSLETGQLVRLLVEQRGVDLEIHLPYEDYPTIDLPYGDHIDEEIWWLAESSQELVIELRSRGGRGGFQLLAQPAASAGSTAKQHVAASRLLYQGCSQLALGRLESARTLIARAQQAWHEVGESAQEAIAWGLLGRIDRLSHDSSSALDAFEQAFDHLDDTAAEALEARLVYDRARTWQDRGEYDDAEADFAAARRLATTAGDLFTEAQATASLAVLDDVRGRLEDACLSYDAARRLYAEHGSMLAAAITQVNLGSCSMKLGSLPEALATLLAALKAMEALPAEDPAVITARAKALREIGWWYHLEGQPLSALEPLRDSAELAPELSYDRLGTVHTALGELETARRYYAKALDEEQKLGNELGAAHVNANLCRLEDLAGHIEEGLVRCRLAYTVFERLGAVGSAAQAQLRSAHLERRRGNLSEAEKLAAAALERIESQRPWLAAVELRSAFLAGRMDAYRLLIDLRMELDARDHQAGWDVRALRVAELSRARSLFEMLSSEKVDPGQQVDPQWLSHEHTVLNRMAHLSKLLGLRLSRHLPGDEIEKELTVLEERLAGVRVHLKQIAPSYLALSHPELPDMAEIQRLLDERTGMLVYQLGDEQSYLWLVEPARVASHRLANRKTIEHLAESWYHTLANPRERWTAGATERRWATQLSDRLLSPIADELRPLKRLVIVADGALLRLPFGALPSPIPDANARPLIVEHEIVNLPSAAVLTILRHQSTKRAAARALLAVIADPVYGASDERIQTPPVSDLPGPVYKRLPETAAEAKDLLALVPASESVLLEGFEARRDRVVSGELADFRIVHFATHAQTSQSPGAGDIPGPLGLALSRLDRQGRPLDGLLGLPDLYSLSLPSELAVLSACGTALGRHIEGEGLIGMTRGFMHAGTPRVVVSLWAVQDSHARGLMSRFYRALLCDQVGPAEALRRAQASMWREKRPTYQWAAFTFHGDWRPFAVNDLRPCAPR